MYFNYFVDWLEKETSEKDLDKNTDTLEVDIVYRIKVHALFLIYMSSKGVVYDISIDCSLSLTTLFLELES